MIRLVAVLLFVAASSPSVFGQAVNIPFIITDGVDSVSVYAGLDPAATSGIDADLGEAELPPLPPHGTFDARFVGTNVNAALGQGSYRDYRSGDAGHAGQVNHELKWQVGSGSQVSIEYDLPADVSAHLHDGFDGASLDRFVRGSGVVDVENAGLTQIRLTLVYGVANAAPRFVSTPLTSARVGTEFEYAIVADDADGDALTLSMLTGPAWLVVEDMGDGRGVLRGTPLTAGSYSVTLEANDGQASAQQSFSVHVSGQAMRQAIFSLSDDQDSITLHAGIDPAATVGIDSILGEAELPPLPPTGSFDARFVGTGVPASLGEGSYSDFRPGSTGFEGDVEHRMRWQLGTGSVLTIAYDLPNGVSGRIQDVVTGTVVDESIAGVGDVTISNTNLTQARLTLTYSSTTVVVSARVTDGSSPVAGVQLRLTGPWTDRQAMTDASGRATFTGVAMGENYVLSIAEDAARYIPRSFTLNDLRGPVDFAFLRTQAEVAPTVTLEHVSQVGSEGANLTFGSGGGLDIPAGSITGDKSIIVGRFDEVPPGVQPAGPLFYFGPPGTTFAVPARITVPYDPDEVPAGTAEEDLRLVRFDETSGTYEEIASSTVNTIDKTISAEISGFSGYGAAVNITVSAETPTDVRFSLDGVYPNPATSTFNVSYSVAAAETVRLRVFDMLGREVLLLERGHAPAGSYVESLDASALPAGVYLLRMETGRGSTTKPLTVTR